MFHSPIAQAGLALLVVATAFTLAVGNRLARAAALLVAANWFLVNLFSLYPAGRQLPWIDFWIDVVFAIGFVALAVGSRRTWSAFLAAFQVLGVANYISYLMDRELLNHAFVTTSYLWALGSLGSVIAAGVSAQRSRRAEAA